MLEITSRVFFFLAALAFELRATMLARQRRYSFFFFCGTGLALRAYTLSLIPPAHFVKDFFLDRVTRTIFPG
jgi:hypothetical protein